jgi:hypothetical protein
MHEHAGKKATPGRRACGLVGLWLATSADEASKQTERGEGDVQRKSAVGDGAGGATGVGEGEREMSTTDTGQQCQHVDTSSSHWRRVTREMSIAQSVCFLVTKHIHCILFDLFLDLTTLFF